MNTRAFALRHWVRSTVCLIATASIASAGQSAWQKVSLVSVDKSSPLTTEQSSPAQLLREDGKGGYLISHGTTSVVVSLPKIESIGSLSFTNNGATGRVCIFVSSTKLPSQSDRWQQIGSQSLTNGSIKTDVAPSDARYVKLTFEIAQPGEISRLGVFATSTIASRKSKDYALLAAEAGENVESDGKTVMDGKDLGESKDIPSEGEAPAEGPAPGLPEPPPFTFVPVLVPTSP